MVSIECHSRDSGVCYLRFFYMFHERTCKAALNSLLYHSATMLKNLGFLGIENTIL